MSNQMNLKKRLPAFVKQRAGKIEDKTDGREECRILPEC
jgi:hypothetical protein